MASARRKPKRRGGRRTQRRDEKKELAKHRAGVRRTASGLRTRIRKAMKASERQASAFKALDEDLKVLIPSLPMRNC